VEQLDRKGEERIKQFGRKKNKEERRGTEKRHKRDIGTELYTPPPSPRRLYAESELSTWNARIPHRV
jgi:hypothetical protein